MTEANPHQSRNGRARAYAAAPQDVPSQLDQRQDEPQILSPIRTRQANSNPMTARVLIWSAAALAVGAVLAWTLA